MTSFDYSLQLYIYLPGPHNLNVCLAYSEVRKCACLYESSKYALFCSNVPAEWLCSRCALQIICMDNLHGSHLLCSIQYISLYFVLCLAPNRQTERQTNRRTLSHIELKKFNLELISEAWALIGQNKFTVLVYRDWTTNVQHVNVQQYN